MGCPISSGVPLGFNRVAPYPCNVPTNFFIFFLSLWCRQFVTRLAYKHTNNDLCVFLNFVVTHNKNTNIETPKYLLH
jgi:hypothetical protein